MNIQPFECGPLGTWAYLINDEQSKEAILVDCPPDAFRTLESYGCFNDYKLQAVYITHGHWDHMADARFFKDSLRIPIVIHSKDLEYLLNPGVMTESLPAGIEGCEADRFVDDNDSIQVGNDTLIAMHVPGHTPGHIALYYESTNALFSGDVLFNGSIGRTDFQGGNYDTLMNSIATKLLTLPDETTVYPGHGPKTTIGTERQTNPFILDYLSHF